MKNASEFLARGPVAALIVAVALAAGAGASACQKAAPSAHADREDDPTRCAGCHTPEFVSTTHPPHPGARPTACGGCHKQTSWGGWRVSHPWWELTGAHLKAAEDRDIAGTEKQVKCFWCHRGEVSTWKGTKKDCLSCHAEDRGTSKFPGHATFADTCEDCHSTTAWKPTTKHIDRPPPEPPVVAAADAGIADAAPDAARPKPVYVPPRPMPTVTAPPTTTVTTPPTVTPPPTPTVTPPRPPPVPTTPPKPPDVITRPSRHG